MTLRVLHVADVLKGGGSEQWIADCIRNAAPDVESHVAVLLDRRYRKGFSLSDDLATAGVPIHHLGPRSTREVLETSGRGSSLKMQHLLRAAFAPVAAAQTVPLLSILRRHRIDVMHAHMNQAYITGALASLLTGIPCVYLVPQTRQQTSHYAPWLFPLYRLLHPGIRLFFTGLSVQELVRSGIPPRKIRHFEAYGDNKAREIPMDQNPVVREWRLDRFSPLLLGVGRLVPEKGFMTAVQAFREVLRHHPRAGLLILGDGWQRSELESYARKEGIADSLILPGFRRDVDLFYPACELFIRPYLFEGVNRSSAPAHWLGRPVVGCRANSPSEHLVDGESGLLTPPGDAPAMAAAILRVLGNPDLRRRLSRGSADVGRELRSSTDAVRLFEAAYRECVRRPAPGGSLDSSFPATPGTPPGRRS